MVSPSQFLIENTLRSRFILVITLVNSHDEEHEKYVKKSKKKFLRETEYTFLDAVLVDDYPPSVMKSNTLYIKRNGKIAWIKMKERSCVF